MAGGSIWDKISEKLTNFKEACKQACSPEAEPVSEPPVSFRDEAPDESPENSDGELVPTPPDQPDADAAVDLDRPEQVETQVRQADPESAVPSARRPIDLEAYRPHEAEDRDSQLHDLSDCLTHLSDTLDRQEQLPQRIADAIARLDLGGSSDELTESLRDLSSESKKQSDLLQGIQNQLSDGQETSHRVAQTLGKLQETLEAANRNSASHVEFMEQVRDHLSSANTDLVDTLDSHSHQLRKIGLALIAMVGVLIVVQILRWVV